MILRVSPWIISIDKLSEFPPRGKFHFFFDCHICKHETSISDFQKIRCACTMSVYAQKLFKLLESTQKFLTEISEKNKLFSSCLYSGASLANLSSRSIWSIPKMFPNFFSSGSHLEIFYQKNPGIWVELSFRMYFFWRNWL